MTVFSSIEELLEFADINGTSYNQDQAVNTVYVILHSTGRFILAIYKWNCMTTVQRTWVSFKQFFGQHTYNSDKPPTSPWKTPECTMQTWCAMWLKGCKKFCSRNKSRRIIQISLKHQSIILTTRCKKTATVGHTVT